MKSQTHPEIHNPLEKQKQTHPEDSVASTMKSQTHGKSTEPI